MYKKLITTAIPYMNGVPHIGHALEAILTDVIVRGYRLVGEDVFFLTGADEHGSKIMKAAETQGKDVMDMLDENVRHFQDMNTALSVVNDGYIRTTDKTKHWPIVQALWNRLEAKGDLYKKSYAGWYCDREERFVTEEELDENKNVKDGGAPTRWTEDENYFFKLSRYSDEIKKRIEHGDVRVIPDFRKNEVLALIGDGLEDVSFSRTKKQLTWGIPVPNDPEHVMYVWCDALTNYISGSPVYDELMNGNIEGEHRKDGKNSDLGSQSLLYANLFKNWSCELHVIGKDISRFHCLTWLGMLLSAEINLPKNILIHGFVNDKDGAKMSKSVGNVVDPQVMVDEYGSDTVRLYMTSEVGVGQDLNFSDDRIKSIHNDVLANNYGNLVNRVISLWIAYRDKGEEIPEMPDLTAKTQEILENYSKVIKDYDTKAYFALVNALLDEVNGMLNTTEPWKKSGIEKGNLLLQGIIYVYYATLVLSPFIPEATQKVMEAMGMTERTLTEKPNIDLMKITKPDILFVKK